MTDSKGLSPTALKDMVEQSLDNCVETLNNVVPDGFFTEYKIHDVEDPDAKGGLLRWCPSKELLAKHIQMQEHYILPQANRSYSGGFAADIESRQIFLKNLWLARNDYRALGANLLRASLFWRFESCHHRGVKPPRIFSDKDYGAFTKALDDIIHAAGGACQARSNLGRLIPYDLNDARFRDLWEDEELGPYFGADDLVNHLTLEHARLLNTFKPVVYRFSEKPEAFLLRESSYTQVHWDAFLEQQAAEKEIQQRRRYDDEVFGEQLNRVNALCGPFFGFQETQAAKVHVDTFGDTIELGEIYYRRDLGAFDYSDDVKLSERSIQSFLYALLERNHGVQRTADAAEKARLEDLREKLNAHPEEPQHAQN